MEAESGIHNTRETVCLTEPDTLSYYTQIPQKGASSPSHSFRYCSSFSSSIQELGSAFLSDYPFKDRK